MSGGTTGVPDHINFIGPFLASWFGRGMWVQLLCPTCGDSLTLRRPSPHRIEWYLSIHRCGPAAGDESGDSLA